MLGIIYKIIDYKEKSSLVYLYTPFGLDSLLVVGAKDYKSSKMAFCEVLNYVNYEKDTSQLPRLLSYEVISRNQNIKNSFTKLKYASVILEVLRQVNDTRAKKIFDFTLDVITKINAGFEPLNLCFIYLVKMLKVFGIYSPNMSWFDDLNIDNAIKLAYQTKDYNFNLANLNMLNKIIEFYNKTEVINTYYIKKILEA